ncbi:lipase member I-like [Haemaphysalis longicornis]
MAGAEASVLLQSILKSNHKYLNASNVHLVGFSLGAHAAGFCGRHFHNATGQKLGRITGLDPAGPLFSGSGLELGKGDADFVDIIHSNAGGLGSLQLGIDTPTGDVDFFPNGGSWQPGCRIPVGCSHTRAAYLFIASLNNTSCKFASHPCPLYGETSEGCNTTEREGEMGYYSIRSQGRGNQYLTTNGSPPFCRNKDLPDNPPVSEKTLDHVGVPASG